MSNSSETQFIKIIKYSPPIFIILASIIITMFLYIEHKEKFIEEKKKIEIDYKINNNNTIKNEVDWTITFINKYSKKNNDALKNILKTRVYDAHTIATSIYNKYKGIKTKDEILELIKVALKDIRFNEGRGYFFMDDISGTKVFYPIDKEVEGKNLSDFKDAKGYALVKTIIKTIEDKSERFDTYHWYKPKIKDKSFQKLSFYKYFAPFNLVIGTGEYIVDFKKKVEKELLTAINELKYMDKNASLFILNYEGVYKLHYDKAFV
jgi:hypothetical protein